MSDCDRELGGQPMWHEMRDIVVVQKTMGETQIMRRGAGCLFNEHEGSLLAAD